MLDYCINFLEDATDFSWSSAKASHAVLLCCIEQGKISSWLETDMINRLRRAHAQRHVMTHTSSGRSEKGQPNGKSIPCEESLCTEGHS